MFKKRNAIEIKSEAEIQLMRKAGVVVAETLQTVAEAAVPGVTTQELDAIAHEAIRSRGAIPSFLGYHGFPAVICTSVNEEVVHGIPGDRVLNLGDLLTVDCGAIVDGWHGDSAVSIRVGEVSAEVAALSDVTYQAMWAGIKQVRAGNRLTDIGHAIESSIRAQGEYGIVQEYGGHGIGSQMHMDPHVLNYGSPGRGPELTVGMALAIEPMVTLGSPEVGVLDDGWTVVTMDDRWACQWEHTVAITPTGSWVLTALDEVRFSLDGGVQ
jgi:methionyl aminopeptidase